MNKLKIRPKAIAFDMDGVIVDSMPYHFISWYEALRPHGIRVSCLDVYSREGEQYKKTIGDLLRHNKIKPTKAILKNIFSRRKRIFKGYFKRFIFGGVKDFLACLKAKKYLLALVTGTPMAEIKKILPKDIGGLFDCVVSGDEVRRGKPDPEPYSKAAKTLKVKPSETIVVENSPLGIRSAKRAGMFCIALTTSLPESYLKKADIVVDRLEEIIKVVDNSCYIKK